MTNRNTQLLEQVIQHIEDRPAQHDQTTWVTSCGTAACFAGWACLLSGWLVGLTERDDVTVISPDGLLERHPAELAIDLLGITEDEADALFFPHNSRTMLRLMVKDLINGDELCEREAYEREAHS